MSKFIIADIDLTYIHKNAGKKLVIILRISKIMNLVIKMKINLIMLIIRHLIRFSVVYMRITDFMK